MVLTKEFRIVLPLAVQEYQVAQLFTVAEMSQQETTGDSGVEILINEPYDDPKLGKGQYTHKIYHLGSRVPRFLALIFPASAFKLEEKAWNSFPYCKTVLTNPLLGERFSVIIESIHLPDNGTTENAHNLEADVLKAREIVHVDIADSALLDAKDYVEAHDPSKFTSQKTSRGPLTGNWKDSASPVMTCYKLVTIKVKIFGFENKTESHIAHAQQNLMVKFHRQLFCLIDKWIGLTMEDIRRLEDEAKHKLDKRLEELNMESRSDK